MTIQRFYYSLLTFLLFTSCEKVIELDLPAQPPKPVIEALLYENAPAIVMLSQTLDIFNADTLLPITDAQIYLTDDLNQRDTLQFMNQGFSFYRGSRITGAAGRTYTLEVIIDGKRYEASSTLLPSVPLDSISIVLDTTNSLVGPQSLPDDYTIFTTFTDPSATSNYYLIDVFYQPQNNSSVSEQSRKIAFSDRYNNGRSVTIPIFDTEIESHDQIQAFLYHVDQPVFEYFRSLDDAALGGSFTSAAPANPKTNFSGGALGFFQASSVSTKLLFIP